MPIPDSDNLGNGAAIYPRKLPPVSQYVVFCPRLWSGFKIALSLPIREYLYFRVDKRHTPWTLHAVRRKRRNRRGEVAACAR